ncbi:MAG: hypothetical protein NC240_06510 [Clostridium sp.]|nr:hypothetical protein [Clostridium sp.]
MDEHYAWGADKFLRGDTDTKRVEEIINDVRNTPLKPGESIYQRIGAGLENVSTEEMLRYFQKNITGGDGLVRDYLENQIINNEINRFRSKEYDNVEMERQ